MKRFYSVGLSCASRVRLQLGRVALLRLFGMTQRDPKDPALHSVATTYQFVRYHELARFLSLMVGRPISYQDVLVLGKWQEDREYVVEVKPDRVWHPKDVQDFFAGQTPKDCMLSLLNHLGEQGKLAQGRYLIDTTWGGDG
jgi:hypothetical protein